MSTRVARVRDLINCELSACDFINQPEAPCVYSVGDHVLLRRPGRYQKRHPPYEPGWVVTSIVVPSTVVVVKLDDSQQLKTVSVDVLKPDPLDDIPAKLSTEDPMDESCEGADIELPDMELELNQPDEQHDHRYGLHDHNAICPPGRYTS